MEYEKNTISGLSNYLKEEFLLEDDEIKEMIEIFIDSTEKLISTAETQLTESCKQLLATTGHSLKGSAANINATGISKLGMALESASKTNDLQKAKEVISALKTAIAELKSQVRK